MISVLELIVSNQKFKPISGVDPGFLEGGLKSVKRGFVCNILPDFSLISP